jgi:hypothetical protein
MIYGRKLTTIEHIVAAQIKQLTQNKIRIIKQETLKQTLRAPAQWDYYEQQFYEDNRVPLAFQRGSIEYQLFTTLNDIKAAYYCRHRLLDDSNTTTTSIGIHKKECE